MSQGSEAQTPNQKTALRATLQSSAVLSLVLMGDSLIYAVLPVMAQEFGVASIWVGVLLSANRFARLIINFSLVKLSHLMDLRLMAIVGAVLGAASTIAYGVVSGLFLMLAARIIWGISFSMLRLVTQGYATLNKEVMNRNLGFSGAIIEVGPILVYTGGVWLVATAGAQPAFLIIGLIGLIALLPALKLPKGLDPAPARRAIRLPRFEDITAFTIFFARSGILMTTASLLFYEDEVSAAHAVFLGALVLLGPRIFRLVVVPFIGIIADRVGTVLIYVISMIAGGLGFLGVGMDFLIPGLILIVAGGTTASVLMPAVAVRRGANETLLDLASVATWGDLGAALGALAGGTLVAYLSLETLYSTMAVILLALAFVEAYRLFRGR